MQGDGNLVIYDPDGRPLWASNTVGHPGSRLVVQDDGNVVIYDPQNVRLWQTVTAPPIINSLTPTSGQTGSAVTIKGDNFYRVLQVLFGDKASNFTVNSQTTITSTVPQNATPGTYNITVVTSIGKAMSSVTFTVLQTPPQILKLTLSRVFNLPSYTHWAACHHFRKSENCEKPRTIPLVA